MNLGLNQSSDVGVATLGAITQPLAWGTCSLRWLLIFWIGACLSLIYYFLQNATLDENYLALIIFGTFLGTIGFVIWLVLPVPVACFLLRRWPRCRRVFLAAVWLGLHIYFLAFVSHGNPAIKFEKITGMSWDLAPCIAEFHATGLADRRHLWVFQGTPEEFKKHLSSLAWDKADEVAIWTNQDDSVVFRKARKAFGNAFWDPKEHYRYYNDRSDEGDLKLPHGDAHLWIDEQHERWIIYWDGM